MVAWADVLRWNPAAIGQVADSLNTACTRLIAANDDVESMARFPGWTGDASVAAASRGNSLISTLEQTVAEASAVSTNQSDIGQHVHSTVAEHDMIKVTNIEVGEYEGDSVDIALGPDPATTEFGGQVFTSDPGTAGPPYAGGLSTEAHSEYWNPKSKSLDNIGRIIAGAPTY